jgi:hypothetical protein
MLVDFLGMGLLDEHQSAASIQDCGAFHRTAARYGIEASLVWTGALS